MCFSNSCYIVLVYQIVLCGASTLGLYGYNNNLDIDLVDERERGRERERERNVIYIQAQTTRQPETEDLSWDV